MTDAPDPAELPADPAPESDRDRVLSLIRARCPELSEDDLALLAPAPDPDALPAAIGEQILDVLDHLMTRMENLEAAVREG